MPSLALSSPSVVPRGGTVTWLNPGNAPGSPPNYASASGCVPGSVCHYLCLKIAAPATPEPVLPTVLTVRLTGHRGTTATSTHLVIDVVGIGVSGPGNNAASNNALNLVDADFTFGVATSGLTLADFNAGRLVLYLGVKAIPTDAHAYDASRWTWTSSPVNQGLAASGPVSLTTPYTVSATYGGPAPAPSAIYLEITSYATGGGVGSRSHATNYTGTASVDDGQRGVASGTIIGPAPDPPPGEQTSTSTKAYDVPVISNVAAVTITPRATSSVTPTATQNSTVGTGITSLSILTPDPGTAYLANASVSYVSTAPPAGGGGVMSTTPMAVTPGYGRTFNGFN